MHPFFIYLAVGAVVALGTLAYYEYEKNKKMAMKTERRRIKSSLPSDRSQTCDYYVNEEKEKPTTERPSRSSKLNNALKPESKNSSCTELRCRTSNKNYDTSSSGSTPIQPKENYRNSPEGHISNTTTQPSIQGSLNSSIEDLQAYHQSSPESHNSSTISQNKMFDENSFQSSSNSSQTSVEDLQADYSLDSHTLSQYEMLDENSIQSSSNSSQNSIEEDCMVCDKTANARFLPCKHIAFCYDHAKYYLDISKNNKTGNVIAKCPFCFKLVEKFI